MRRAPTADVLLVAPRRTGATHGSRRFVTCTASGAAARSTVDALTLRAVTRTLLFDHAWQSSTKAMLLVSSNASPKSVRRWRTWRPDVELLGPCFGRRAAWCRS